MKKGQIRLQFLITFSIMVLLSSCRLQAQGDLGNSYVAGQDMQYMYWHSGYPNLSVVEGSNGYYFMEEDFLYFTDKSTMKTVALCNKPNCLHQAETDPQKISECNAYIPAFGNSYLSWWDGSLYAVVTRNQDGEYLGKEALMRISSDGTQREYICELSTEPSCATVHRGKFYYGSYTYSIEEGIEADYQVKCIDLTQKGAKEEILLQGNKPGGYLQHMLCYGDGLYISVIFYEGDKSVEELHRLDLLTKEDKILNSDLLDTNKRMYLATIYDNQIYARIINIDKDLMDEENRTLWKMDLDGQNRQKAFVMEGTESYPYVYADQNYFYLFTEWVLKSDSSQPTYLAMVDNTGNKIGEVEFSDVKGDHIIFAPGEGDYLFLSSNENYQVYHRYIVDKRELLEKGTARPIEISSVTMNYTGADYS